MSVHGTITLEATRFQISFNLESSGEILYWVTDSLSKAQTLKVVPMDAFFKALAIAVHPDGAPNAEADYPDAESVMPDEPELRWIP